jgi:hypothetical protein
MTNPPCVRRVVGSESETVGAPGGTAFGPFSHSSARRFVFNVMDGDLVATKAELMAEACAFFPTMPDRTDLFVHSYAVSKIRVGG